MDHSFAPYYVSWEQTTTDEPLSGWYWADEEDILHGPYWTMTEARNVMRDILRRPE